MFLISVILVSVLWVWSLKYREGPLQLKGREIPERVLTFGLLIMTLFIFYLSSATTVLLWLLTATVIFVFGHALFITPPVIDEFGFGTPGQQPPQFMDSV